MLRDAYVAVMDVFLKINLKMNYTFMNSQNWTLLCGTEVYILHFSSWSHYFIQNYGTWFC
jgi:hypothetical protein